MEGTCAGTGFSGADSPEEAGRAAAELALADLGGGEPDLVLVFTTPRWDLRTLISAVRSVTGAAPLAGATSSGQIVAGHFVPQAAGVAVLALRAPGYRFALGSASGMGADPDGTGQALTRACRAAAVEHRGEYAALLVFSDGLAGDQQGLVRGIHRVAGAAVPICGGAAADDRTLTRTSVFHDGEVLSDAAVGVWITSGRPLRVVVKHGWQPAGLPVLVTRSEDRMLLEIAGRPALEVYTEQLGEDAVRLTTERFTTVAATNPIGLIQPDGSFLIRNALGVEEDGSMRMTGAVPVNSAIQVMHGDAESLLASCRDVAAEALRDVPAPGILLTISCVARQNVYAGRIAEEAQRLQKGALGTKTFGFYSYGEFARSSNVLGFHNSSVVGLAL